jgi:hypothetical protein
MYAVDREKSSNTCAVTGREPIPFLSRTPGSVLEKGD